MKTIYSEPALRIYGEPEGEYQFVLTCCYGKIYYDRYKYQLDAGYHFDKSLTREEFLECVK